ncbi:MAG: hypothetical protein ACU0C9_10755, partial [Paracoccaceae bacterium]
MDHAKTLTFYLNASMRKRAESGQTNIINRMVSAFDSCGYQCLFKGNTAVDLLKSVQDPGLSLFHMEDPFHSRALNLRRAYYYPFWRIEASAKRWEWAVAGRKFDPGEIDRGQARTFASFWRDRLFDNVKLRSAPSGTIYVPLQGRLLDKRSFQTMSPLDMLNATLLADKQRRILVSLHPRETYSDPEMLTLNALIEHQPRLQLVTGDRKEHSQSCDYTVAQNSSLVLDGYFHHKPAILFAEIDFHHIAHNVADQGAAGAFSKVLTELPDFDAYVYWFLQQQSINAGRDDAEQKILQTVRS